MMIIIPHQPFGFRVQNNLPGNPIPVQLVYHLTPSNDEELKVVSSPQKAKLRIV